MEDQKTEDVRNLEGTEPVTGLADEASSAEDTQEQEQSSTSKSVPYERFAETIQQKNEAIQRAANLENTVMTMQEQLNALAKQNSTPQDEMSDLPEFDSIPDLVKYMDQRVEQRAQEIVQKTIQPIEQQTKAKAIESNIEGYFQSNKDAAALKDQMNEYTKGFSEARTTHFFETIAKGDTSVLDEIYYVTAAKNKSQLQNQVNEQVKQEGEKVAEPANYRSYPKQSGEEQMAKAKKNGDFTGYWQQLAQQNFG